jgi:hypothetical protein
MIMLELAKTKWRQAAPKIMGELKKRHFDPYFFESVAEAGAFITDQIEPGASVGVGGSLTIRESLGLVKNLRARGTEVVDHWDAGPDAALRLDLKKKQRAVDVFLSGVNALTTSGILVNLDGGGNRLAGLLCGPRRVIVALGTNKITESLDLAIERTRHHAAVLNAIRLKRRVPCVETGLCNDCQAPDRVCAALLVLMTKPEDIERFSVVLINEDLGF